MIYAETEAEHNRKLEQILEPFGNALNKEKFCSLEGMSFQVRKSA
jgi:hypothetical protein